MRISNKYLLIGVPYKQDIRVGKTTCSKCSRINPPWGHVNIFSKSKLLELFPIASAEQVHFVGKKKAKTNLVSSWLMNKAGNPTGTYDQDERCVFCKKTLIAPTNLNGKVKKYTAAAQFLDRIQKNFVRKKPNWIHVLFRKN